LNQKEKNVQEREKMYHMNRLKIYFQLAGDRSSNQNDRGKGREEVRVKGEKRLGPEKSSPPHKLIERTKEKVARM